MPKYRPETARAKAKALLKPILKNGLNIAATARDLGLSQPTVQERFHQPFVQDALKEYLDSPGLKAELEKVAKEGLAANRLHSANIVLKKDPKTGKAIVVQSENDYVEIEDHGVRHKFWHDLMVIGGHLKETNGGQKVQVFVGSDLLSRIEALEKDKVKSRVGDVQP